VVAVKVLPAALTSDSEHLKRFEKEARSASSLNHPNIDSPYDIGSEDGVSYIAMVLLAPDGKSYEYGSRRYSADLFIAEGLR
jgi:serine/threonine protein kinase